MNAFETALREGFLRVGGVVAPPEETALERMLQHAALLERWNKTHNLTSVEGAEPRAEALFIDSWLIRALGDLSTGPLIDVGGGGGFPALVLLSAEPEREALLFEKVEKKRSFLSTAIATLGLKRATVARETFPPRAGGLPGAPRLLTSRATFAPADWLAIAATIAAPGDRIVVQASQDAPPESGKAWHRTAMIETALPFSGAKRRVAIYAFAA